MSARACYSFVMKKFFAPNLEARGRMIRGVTGGILIGAGLALRGVSPPASLLLLFGGGFALFEALRGWCVMRACGVKTKL